MIFGFLYKLFGFIPEEKDAPSGARHRMKALQPLSDVEKKLEHIIANSILVNTGQVHLLELGEIKRGLGEKWPSLRERVLETLDRIVARHIGVNDVFFSRSDEEHIIVFSNRSSKVARLICAKILQELTGKYLGSFNANETFIKTAIGRAQGRLLFEKSSIDDIFEEVMLAPVSQDGEEKNDGDKPVFTQGEGHDEVVYKPIWDAQNEVISTYMVNARHINSYNKVSLAYDILSDPENVNAMIELDNTVLAEAVDMMNELYINNFRAIFSIPICYETVFNWERLKDFLSHLRLIPPELFKYIAFTLVDFPDGVPEIKLQSIVSNLLHYSRAIAMTSGEIPQNISYYQNCGIKTICLAVPKKNNSPLEFWKTTAKFIEDCHHRHIYVSLENIDTLDDLILAKESGVHFLSGDAIAPYCDIPGHMSHTTLKDLIAK